MEKCLENLPLMVGVALLAIAVLCALATRRGREALGAVGVRVIDTLARWLERRLGNGNGGARR